MRGFGIFLGIFAACVIAGALALTLLWRNLKGPVTERFEHLGNDAVAFAASHEQSDCAPEALQRLSACYGLWCRVEIPVFTKLCLHRAHPSPDLCDEVPHTALEAALWPAKTCLVRSADGGVCRQIFGEVLKICAERAER